MGLRVIVDDELGAFTYEVPLAATLQFRTRKNLSSADTELILEVVRRELKKLSMHPSEILLAHGLDTDQSAHRVRSLCMPSWYEYPGEDSPGNNINVEAAVVDLHIHEEESGR